MHQDDLIMLINHIPHALVMAIHSQDDDRIIEELYNAINSGALHPSTAETDADCIAIIKRNLEVPV
jgi:hypothetical protein